MLPRAFRPPSELHRRRVVTVFGENDGAKRVNQDRESAGEFG